MTGFLNGSSAGKEARMHSGITSKRIMMGNCHYLSSKYSSLAMEYHPALPPNILQLCIGILKCWLAHGVMSNKNTVISDKHL